MSDKDFEEILARGTVKSFRLLTLLLSIFLIYQALIFLNYIPK